MRFQILEPPSTHAELLLVAEEGLKELGVERVKGEGGVGVLWAVRVLEVNLGFGGNVMREELGGGVLGSHGFCGSSELDAVHGLGAGLVAMVWHGMVMIVSIREVGHGVGARSKNKSKNKSKNINSRYMGGCCCCSTVYILLSRWEVWTLEGDVTRYLDAYKAKVHILLNARILYTVLCNQTTLNAVD